ncbi:glutamine-rich protein [Pimephales promelas]|nr:glutamine-rich protein [Pimephales promelas]
MSTDISLHELLDLSIGTPDVGAVNFNALHTLLHAILGHLKIERVKTAWKEAVNEHDSPAPSKASLLEPSSPLRVMEERVRGMEEQLRALEALPTASELMGSSDTALGDMWTLMQLRRKAQGNEDGVSKCMDLIQDLLKEVQALKESRDDLRQEVHALNGQLSQVNAHTHTHTTSITHIFCLITCFRLQLNMNELDDRFVAMEQYCNRVQDLDNTTKELKDKMAQYPVPEELNQCVKWDEMRAALISERQKIQEGLQGTVSAAKDSVPVLPLNLGSPMKDDRPGTGGTDGVDLSPPHQSLSDEALSRVSVGAERYPETVEALKEVGRLRDRHESLETRVGQLEANKADRTQLQHLQDLLTAMGERQIPDHVPEQLNHLRTLVDSLLEDKEKVSEVESVLMNMSSDTCGRSTGSASDQDTDASQIEHLTLQTSNIRIAVLKLDEKVQVLMREESDRVEERSSQDRHIQEQLNSLRVMIEEVMSSSSSPLSKSQQQEAVEFSKAAAHVQSSGQGQPQSSGRVQSLGQGESSGQGQPQSSGRVQRSGQNQAQSSGQVQSSGQNQAQSSGQVQSSGQNQAQSSGQVQSSGQNQAQSLGQVQSSGQDQAQSLGQDQAQSSGQGESSGQDQAQSSGQVQSSGQNQAQNSGQVQSSGQNQAQSLGQVQSSGQDQAQSSGQAESSGQDQAQTSGQVQSSGQDQGQSSGQDQGQQQKEGHDLNQEVSQLPKSYYKPPEDKTTHMKNQEHWDRIKSTDAASDVEGVLLRLQADSERLHSTCKRLMEEHSEKQIHIDRLYKVLEELDDKKADKELLEMKIETKADKRALESKVSRMQFDSMIEQLNNMLQELLGKISGQEKDWNKLIEKISTEMDCKLNRIELDPLKKQLDDRWRNIHKSLQTQSLPEQDDAAGLRKQLVARFHCISCDRPVEMMTPGQLISTLPSAPGLPSHRSSRPYSVYELEQMRQHCRRQIDQEPSQFPTSRTPNSLRLPELSRTGYRPTSGPGKRSSRTPSKPERIPEMADYSYLARSCGGSHTLTYPSRRYTRIQHFTHLIQSDEESRPVSSGPPTQAEEANIMGLNGQVYKGRMNSRAVRLSETRLPTISPREGNWKSKDKVSRSQSQRSSGSAKTQHSHSASSNSVRDRPPSSVDCLSQDVPLQSSFHDTTTERNKDFNQSEDEPVTSL